MDLKKPEVVVEKSDWVDWKNNPVTKLYIHALFTKREAIKEALAEGQIAKEAIDLHIGQCQGIKDTIDFILYDQLVGDEESDESTRT